MKLLVFCHITEKYVCPIVSDYFCSCHNALAMGWNDVGFKSRQGEEIFLCSNWHWGGPSASCLAGTESLYVGGRQLGCEVKSEWSFTCTSLVCHYGMYRDSITFTLICCC